LSASALVAIASLIFAATWIGSHSDNVYVLDKGGAFSATVSAGEVQRDLEAIDHVTRFHEHLFNLSPSSEAIQRSVEQALVMADKSAYNYYRDFAEQGFYNRIIAGNINQTVRVDSVVCDFDSYPYQVRTFARQTIIRESNVTERTLVTECRLMNSSRSDDNPNGFQIRNFTIIENRDIRTVKK
jgi:conjugative transposon TraK protein